MPRWTITAYTSRDTFRLRVRDYLGDELLHAQLPLPPDHPRALLTLLESIALWNGEPARAVLVADDSADPLRALGVSSIPTSALVRCDLAPPRIGQRRLRLKRLAPRLAPEEVEF